MMEPHLDQLIQRLEQIIQHLEVLEAVFTPFSRREHQCSIGLWKSSTCVEANADGTSESPKVSIDQFQNHQNDSQE